MMLIKTKWGKLQIDPNRIHEINVQLNPWDNIYRIEFTVDGSFERLVADVESPGELAGLVRRVASELAFVRQYKYKDRNGVMQINEPRRLQMVNRMENENE